ncbi:MAG: response regulator [Lewinellaceae bacterium]|nr:response regulator [Lewinellaceae bacterium]
MDASLGLPEGHVLDMVQDSLGFLWIGSSEGLFKYDGHQFQGFQSDFSNQASLSSNKIRKLLIDRRGDLWVGTVAGLNRIDRKTGAIKRYINLPGDTLLPSEQINALFMDQEGDIWISTSLGYTYFDVQKQQFVKLNPYNFAATDQNSVFKFYTGIDGNVSGISINKILVFDKKKGSFASKQIQMSDGTEFDGNLYRLIKERSGTVWVATTSGLYQLDEKRNMFLKPLNLPEEIRKLPAGALLLDKSDFLWAGWKGSIMRWRPGDSKVQFFSHHRENTNGLLSDVMYCFLEDREGTVWIGSEQGISGINLAAQKIRFYQTDPTSRVSSDTNQVISALEANDGSIWWAGKNAVYKAASLGGTPKQVMPTPSELRVNCLYQSDNGVIWGGLGYKGIWAYNPEREKFEQFNVSNQLDNSIVYDIEPDPEKKGRFWLGTSRGLCRFDPVVRDSCWIYPSGAARNVYNWVKNFCISADGDFWMDLPESFGHYDHRSSKITKFSYNPLNQNSLSSNLVNDVFESPAGTLWILMESGLSKFDIATTTFTHYNHNNGIRGGNNVTSGQADRGGKIWFTTSGYLTCLDPKTGKFQYFSRDDGVFTRFNQACQTILRDGTLLFGGGSGLVAVPTELHPAIKQQQQAVLTNVWINNKLVNTEGMLEYLEQLELQPSEKVVAFEFSSNSFIASGRHELVYRLLGFDDHWVHAGADRRATFTNLSPKNYVFEVAILTEGEIPEEGSIRRLGLRVIPFFWQSTWFRSLLVLVFGVITYLLIQNSRQKRHLQQEKLLAEQNARYKSKFLANMSHEIRTPMNAIIGLSRLMLETELNEKQKQYATAALQSGENLLWIVNDILDQEKLESGLYTFNNQAFYLEEVLQQLRSTFAFRAADKKLQFDIICPPDVPNHIIGDRIRLYQILTNLTANAIRFTEQGMVRVEVKCSAVTADHAHFVFSVSDTGRGIPADQQEFVFESFRQLGNDQTHLGGTGLGLSIARELVQQQGGKISVESQPGKGSVFSVELQFDCAPNNLKRNGTLIRETGIRKGLRILLVEDDPLNQMLARELLQKFLPSPKLEIADNGQVAIEKVLKQRFDLILMDVKMPVMDGLEATRLIRGFKQPIANVPILALTANAIKEELERCKQAGMNDCVTKPINIDQLLEKIKSLV